MTAPFAYGVFISYRRCDAGPYARLLQVQLGQHLAGTPVFMDVDSIEAGTDFADAIKTGVESCRVLIALIGAKWLTVPDKEGRRRLDNPDDYVRYEIRTALARRIRVIPVLVDGAAMPDHHQLPDDLGGLARLNALPMSYDRYEYDEGRLITIIGKALAAETTETAGAPAGLPRQDRRPATAITRGLDRPAAGAAGRAGLARRSVGRTARRGGGAEGIRIVASPSQAPSTTTARCDAAP